MNNIKHYVDLKFLGSGWFGEVYGGYDSHTNNKVAIKEIKDLKKAKQEIEVMEVLRKISSAYLPTFYESFYLDNKGYIVMEYIEGMPLGGPLFKDGEKRTEKQSVQICINILKGLRDLHNAGFIHNDIVPKNMMMRENLPDTIKLIDFGSAYRIKKLNDIHQELKKVCLLCVYLINGQAPTSLVGDEITNQKLNSILLKSFSLNESEKFNSAKELIRALKQFLKENP